jgi:hypothetical protein
MSCPDFLVSASDNIPYPVQVTKKVKKVESAADPLGAAPARLDEQWM